jgi:hypothetical protein
MAILGIVAAPKIGAIRRGLPPGGAPEGVNGHDGAIRFHPHVHGPGPDHGHLHEPGPGRWGPAGWPDPPWEIRPAGKARSTGSLGPRKSKGPAGVRQARDDAGRGAGRPVPTEAGTFPADCHGVWVNPPESALPEAAPPERTRYSPPG